MERIDGAWYWEELLGPSPELEGATDDGMLFGIPVL